MILAAGNGSRLDARGEAVPKPLRLVGGRPLLAHALDQASAARCNEAIVIVGHRADEVRRFLGEIETPFRLRVVHNPRFDEPNGVSLLAAETSVAGGFFLQMTDHVFASPVLARLAAAEVACEERLLVDRVPSAATLIDATKVRLDGSRVVAIGKRVDPWDAVDAGCFVLTPQIFPALRRIPEAEPKTVSAGMRQLIATASLVAVDVAGTPWIDVDTAGDLEIAERLVTAEKSLSPQAASRTEVLRYGWR